jgi:hypothetical protein
MLQDYLYVCDLIRNTDCQENLPKIVYGFWKILENFEVPTRLFWTKKELGGT